MKKRHILFYNIFLPLTTAFAKIRFGYKFTVPENLPENYIVISNHTTDYDMLFVGASFKRQMYFVASEHIARWGIFSRFLMYAFAPIMRHKGASALSTVLDILKKTKKGYNVCLFAEGVRTWNGVTNPISKSTADLVKRAGCGLVTYKITGGYFASPMWAGASVRKGPVKGTPVSILTKEEIKNMTSDEIYELIVRDIHEDAYEHQISAPAQYKGKNLAEGLERMLFICPKCSAHDSLKTNGNTVTCESCAHSFTYDIYGMLNGTRFKTLKEFYEWLEKSALEDIEKGVEYSLDNVDLFKVDEHNSSHLLNGNFKISPTAITSGEKEFPLADISDLAMHGQKAIVFTCSRDYYEAVIPDNSCALKFLMYFNMCKKHSETPVSTLQ